MSSAWNGSTRPVALITGAGSGIGRAVAIRLAPTHHLVMIDRDGDSLAATTAALSGCVEGPGCNAVAGNGGVPMTLCIDVRDEAAIARAIEEAVRMVGHIDHLAHCAGILGPVGAMTTGEQNWREVFEVNLFGAINVIVPVAAMMRNNGGGSIVAVGSNAGHTPRQKMAAYGASKAALSSAMATLGLELAADGVRVNVVAPGSTDTPMQTQLVGDTGVDAAINGDPLAYRLGIPLRRIAFPEDIANVIRFLLSDESRHITMQTITVDGGATL